MKEIGGYFELELPQKEEHHKNGISLNSARNAFKYILQAQAVLKVYLPTFICNSMLEPLEELKIDYEFYGINEKFEINEKFDLKTNEKLVYVNYFGLKSKYIHKLSTIYNNNLIVDNTQAFFELPIKNIDTIYSARKFFGVSDGGYLYTTKFLNKELKVDSSYESSIQLVGRIDQDASEFYKYYQKSENRLINLPIKFMSKLTKRILGSIDYKDVQVKRERNFDILHRELKKYNKLKIEIEDMSTPLIYPFMSEDKTLRDKLIANKIYVAQYWCEVLKRKKLTDIEKLFVNQIIPLPVDQRYNSEDMHRILKVIIGS